MTESGSHILDTNILLGFALVALIAVPIIQVIAIFSAQDQGIINSQDSLFAETLSMTIANGTLISFYTNDLEEIQQGVYNVTVHCKLLNLVHQSDELPETVLGGTL